MQAFSVIVTHSRYLCRALQFNSQNVHILCIKVPKTTCINSNRIVYASSLYPTCMTSRAPSRLDPDWHIFGGQSESAHFNMWIWFRFSDRVSLLNKMYCNKYIIIVTFLTRGSCESTEWNMKNKLVYGQG
jgi:hypothetical protein